MCGQFNFRTLGIRLQIGYKRLMNNKLWVMERGNPDAVVLILRFSELG